MKGFIDSPGPQRMKAWKPVGGIVACGIVELKSMCVVVSCQREVGVISERQGIDSIILYFGR